MGARRPRHHQQAAVRGESHLNDGTLVEILKDTPPASVQLAAIYPHKRFQDPKVRLMIDFMAERCQRMIGKMLE